MKAVTVRALGIGVLLGLVVVGGTVSAHAEFESGTPENGATVGTGPIDIVATFSEELAPNSHMELLDSTGTVVARAAVDGNQMRIGLEGLEPGEYAIKWTSVADDGDVLRNTDQPWTFTVAAAASPSPSSAAQSSAPPSASASEVPSASPARSSPPAAPSSSSSGEVLLPIIAAIVATALLGAWLLRRRSYIRR